MHGRSPQPVILWEQRADGSGQLAGWREEGCPRAKLWLSDGGICSPGHMLHQLGLFSNVSAISTVAAQGPRRCPATPHTDLQ